MMRVFATLLGAVVVLAAYDRKQPFKATVAYQVDMEFHIPYMKFVEPVYGYFDSAKEAVRLSYFSGMDTYIYKGNISYGIYPVQDKMDCFITDNEGSPVVFPELKYFTLQAHTQDVVTKAFPQGVTCDVWTFTNHNQTTDQNGNATAYLPNQDGYAGVYTFYVSAMDGTPVQFHALGHNVVLGGSHVDEYSLVYLQIIEVDSVSESLFLPPNGMPCVQGDNPYGPTSSKQTGRSNPTHDFDMLFPHGAEKRQQVFKDYAKKHKKMYKDTTEYQQRHDLFHRALRYINAANRRGRSYTLAPNHLADLTEGEKEGMRGGGNKRMEGAKGGYDPQTYCGEMKPSNDPLPLDVDWRAKSQGGTQDEPGLVLPPKDQGACGSCWTYGATGTVEGTVAKATGNLVALSEQSIMDCAWTEYGNAACGGGNDFTAFWWLMTQGNNGSMATDESYGGYLNQNGFCHFDIKKNETTNPWTGKPVQAGAVVESCVHTSKMWQSMDTKVIPDSEATDLLNQALYNYGPISVSIDASPPDFYYYDAGLYYNPDCSWNDLDHTVLAAGYKTVGFDKYTLVRNSWSTHWGEEGYIWISQKDNNCGVATTPIYTTLKDAGKK